MLYPSSLRRHLTLHRVAGAGRSDSPERQER
jgi:hypothetical protein